MQCLLAVSFNLMDRAIMHHNAVLNKQKLTASKLSETTKPHGNSAFGVWHSAKYPCHGSYPRIQKHKVC